MKRKRDKKIEAKYIMQDGVQCPVKPPWGPNNGRYAAIPGLIFFAMPVFILFKTSIPALIVWLAAFFIFAVPLRLLICARCPYYGMDCSTGAGKMVPYLFKKREGSMVLGLWLDVVFGLFLFIQPAAYMHAYGGWILLLIWIAVFILMFSVTTRFGCLKCPFTFCPIGKGGRIFWGFFGVE